jgi:3-dehydroquinate synthase
MNTVGIPTYPILLPSGESAKSLEQVTYCWNLMYSHGLDRKSLILSLGGGTISDTAGFAASCYMRGLDLIHIPTTLLAMVDASIGGKTGINFGTGKNLIGTLHQPRLVLISPHFLASLPDREFRSGLAEVIKAGFIWDPDLVEFLERYMSHLLNRDAEKIKSIIAKACKIKAEVIRIDEKEKNLRSILNYGHTFAHAIEAATQYNRYTHGETVSIGMSCAARISREMGYVDADFVKRQTNLCQQAGLPVDLPSDLPIDALIELMSRDKKAVLGKINLILPRKIGKVDKINDIDPALIKRALAV